MPLMEALKWLLDDPENHIGNLSDRGANLIRTLGSDGCDVYVDPECYFANDPTCIETIVIDPSGDWSDLACTMLDLINSHPVAARWGMSKNNHRITITYPTTYSSETFKFN